MRVSLLYSNKFQDSPDQHQQLRPEIITDFIEKTLSKNLQNVPKIMHNCSHCFEGFLRGFLRVNFKFYLSMSTIKSVTTNIVT